MLLCADPEAAAAAMAAGTLGCPSCGSGRLSRHGYGREREIRMPGGGITAARFPRGRCRSCDATHMLLPGWAVPRRKDTAGVIARAAVASVLDGAGSRRLGRETGVPAATVRGWLRRLRLRAGSMRQDATAALGVITAGRDWPCMDPCGSPLGDALAAVIACARAAIILHGYGENDLDALLGRFGISAALAPAPGS